MTEEITPRNGHPSSADLDIAKLRERHNALKADMSSMRGTMADIKELLIGHMQNSDGRHAQLLATFNQHNLEDAVVHQKLIVIAETVKEMGSASKRDPATFWTSVGAIFAGAGAVLWSIFGGK